MASLEERFRRFKEFTAPDLWPEVARRRPQPLHRIISWRRLGVAAVALAVAGAGIALAIRAFIGEEGRSRPADAPQLGSAQILATIRVGDRGDVRSVVYGFDSVWVSGHDEEGQYLLRVDPATNDIVARIPSVSGVWDSGGVVVGRDALWVTGVADGGGAVAHQIDPNSNAVVRTVNLGPGLGADVAIASQDVWIVVSEWPGESKVVRLDGETGRIEASIPLEFEWARTILAAQDALWVETAHRASTGSGPGRPYLTAIDPATNRVIQSLGTESFPAAVDGSVLWRTRSIGSVGALEPLDAATGAVVGPAVRVANGPVGDLAIGNGGVWFVSRSDEERSTSVSVSRFNPETQTVDGPLEIDSGVIDLVFSSDSLWLLGWEGTLTRVSLG
jgi:hypothetical protein